MLRDASTYLGIFLISAATLILEISLTRVFSVSQWYHFAFMVVSIALFGIGASGTFLSVFPSLIREDLDKSLSNQAFLFSLSTLLTFAITNRIPFDPFRMAFDPLQLLYLFIYYSLLSIPFFFSGLCIALALTKMARKAGRLYSSSLAGSGLGSLLVLTLFSPLGGSGVIIFASMAGALSSIVFRPLYRRSYLAISWMLVLAFLFTQPFLHIRISPYKSLNMALRYPGAEVLHTEWNSFSRVDVVRSPFVRHAPGLSYEYLDPLPPQLGITIDGGGMSAITRYGDAIQFTGFLTSSIPYRIKDDPRVLILGSGGGLEVLAALHQNASSITAVEVNPIIVDLVKDRYADFSGGIYQRAEVEVSESRSFVRRSEEKYDIIQLTLAEGAAASSTGVYALTENYVYTVEAFEEYLRHLTDEGVLSITRWLLPPPREAPRIVALAVEALERQGIEDPGEHIAAIRSWGTITILVKKSGFTREDIEGMKEFCREKRFDIVYAPGIKLEEVNIYNRFPEPYYYQVINGMLSSENRKGFYDDYLFDISPVTDERPFFFHFFKLRKIIPTYESVGKKWQPFIEGGYLVPIVFIQALFLSLIFILLPVYRFRKPGEVPWRLLVYFLCLGIGYMFIEIAMIQKFILFLGHPTFAVSIVLFSILTFSGMGSLFSERLEVKRRAFTVAILVLGALVLLYLISLPSIFRLFLGGGLVFRGAVSTITLAPLAFFMGMPFPLGIRLTEAMNRDLIPWAWAVNGCASVLSSILAVMVALSFGFSSVLAWAALVYLAGLGVVLSLGRVFDLR